MTEKNDEIYDVLRHESQWKSSRILPTVEECLHWAEP
jgi:hypothetical protein